MEAASWNKSSDCFDIQYQGTLYIIWRERESEREREEIESEKRESGAMPYIYIYIDIYIVIYIDIYCKQELGILLHK